MAGDERDSTQDWLLPAEARPPTMFQLEQKVDVALAVARSSEAAALEIGAAALDAAQQAHRAAELAERASAAVSSAKPALGNGDEPTPGNAAETGDERLRHFTERADRVVERLLALR